jgi:hypothetical protein
MNSRHAAAIALVGWYLMLPPALDDPNRPKALIDVNAPISEWSAQGTFDTAQECKQARDAGKQEFYRSDFWNKSKKRSRVDSIKLLQKSEAACIASDDPRLKRK